LQRFAATSRSRHPDYSHYSTSRVCSRHLSGTSSIVILPALIRAA
jgi:hypothetical protein